MNAKIEIPIAPGCVYLIHGGPTTGKSHVYHTFRKLNPRDTKTLVLDTDDVIWITNPGHFIDKDWQKGADPTSTVREWVLEWMSNVEAQGRLTGIILTNLWNLFPPERYLLSAFCPADEIVRRSITRGSTPMAYSVTAPWVSSWSHYCKIRQKVLLDDGTYLSDLLDFEALSMGTRPRKDGTHV